MPLTLYRPGTDDEHIWHSVLFKDEYRVPRFEADDVVIDLGAHVGAFSQRAHDQGSRRIYAFEACPLNYDYALANVAVLPGVVVKNRAVVARDAGFSVPFSLGLNSRFIPPHDGEVHVPTTTLDAIVAEIPGDVRLLKIDVEGSEWEILYTFGGFDRVREIVGEYHQPCETWPLLERRPGLPQYEHGALQKFLEAHGYRTEFWGYESERVQAGLFRAVR